MDDILGVRIFQRANRNALEAREIKKKYLWTQMPITAEVNGQELWEASIQWFGRSFLEWPKLGKNVK